MPRSELDHHILELARRLLRRVRARVLSSSAEGLDLARRVASRFPEPPDVRELRFSTTQRARWGSYSLRTGVIRIHAALRLMPRWVLEAVVAHELAHAFHPGHGPAFWRLLNRVCPETERARAFLAGVSWLAASWESLPPVERAQLGLGAPEAGGYPQEAGSELGDAEGSVERG
jgi:predicted metal-dependent hydrolase